MAITVNEQSLLEMLAEAYPLIESYADFFEESEEHPMPHARSVLGRIEFVLRAAGLKPCAHGERIYEHHQIGSAE
jgi:hypothetical protein